MEAIIGMARSNKKIEYVNKQINHRLTCSWPPFYGSQIWRINNKFFSQRIIGCCSFQTSDVCTYMYMYDIINVHENELM